MKLARAMVVVLLAAVVCFGCSSKTVQSHGSAVVAAPAQFTMLEGILDSAGWQRQSAARVSSSGVVASSTCERRGTEITLLLLDNSQVFWTVSGRDAESVEGASQAVGEWLSATPGT